jgi:hypothetical protein
MKPPKTLFILRLRGTKLLKAGVGSLVTALYNTVLMLWNFSVST